MFAWILQISIISIALIYLVHHLIDFFKSMLTVPKIKDLVETPNQKYKNIFSQMDNKNTFTESPKYSEKDLIPTADENPMKRDLKMFLKKQLNANSSENTTDIFALDSNYSSYV